MKYTHDMYYKNKCLNFLTSKITQKSFCEVEDNFFAYWGNISRVQITFRRINKEVNYKEFNEGFLIHIFEIFF